MDTRKSTRGEAAHVPEKKMEPAGQPSGPVDRDEHGNPIDWSRPDTLRTKSGMGVVIWFLLPLIAILIYGMLTR